MKGIPHYDALLSRSITKEIVACPNCGYPLVAGKVTCHLVCQACKRKYSERELYEQMRVVLTS